jgi:NhaP-type Na+/H+ and K+/H+ antiporter
VVRWLADHELTVGDLLRHPDDRSAPLPVVPLLVVRGAELILTPDDDTSLRIGDQLLLAGKDIGLSDLSDALFSSATIEYITTGRVVPSTWVWRALTGRRRAAARAG